MKKAYSAPDILYESFSLCASIAAGCEIKISTQTSEVCGMLLGPAVVFTDKVIGCDTKVEDGSPLMNGICYHVPIDRMTLFNS